MTQVHDRHGDEGPGEAEAFGKVLGQVITQLRKQHGDMTQAELAAKLGISQSALSKIEAGKLPDAFLYGRIAKAFQLEVHELDRRVHEAMRRAREAAAAATHRKTGTSWGELLAIAGFVGLIAFAVAAVLGDDDPPKKDPEPPQPAPPPSSPGG
jgi:transcriptional regulator with XRE-family HTH domain